jgi:2-polyprenyl-6-methoxyphenol hydroxylase-like FAD-dependent oxidoreductase
MSSGSTNTAKSGVSEFLPVYESWRFDWLDVPQMIRDSEQILEYPMVDRDPIENWTFGRVTLAGDAAHPMYPRGSNGALCGDACPLHHLSERTAGWCPVSRFGA